MSINCYKCHTELELSPNQDIPRSEECHDCYANVRCCMMCTFYDKQSYNECREPTADRIVEKDKSNFCDHYKLGDKAHSENIQNDAMSAANELFKK